MKKLRVTKSDESPTGYVVEYGGEKIPADDPEISLWKSYIWTINVAMMLRGELNRLVDIRLSQLKGKK